MDNRTDSERLAAIEVKVSIMCKQMAHVHTKLDMIIPLVIENSWWVGKIKWAFVFIAVVGVIGGIVTFATRS